MSSETTYPVRRLSLSGQGGATHQCDVGWDGSLLGDWIAIDTETVSIDQDADAPTVPKLILMSAADWNRVVIIRPEQVAPFLVAHSKRQIITFNAAFDFWVLIKHVGRASQAGRILFEAVEKGALRDAMLLDQLTRLAETGEDPSPRTLAEVAKEYASVQLNKEEDEKYRLNYQQIDGADWATLAENWFRYAALDAAAALQTYVALTLKVDNLLRTSLSGMVDSACRQRWGLLTERIQVMGAIAMDDARRSGIGVDTDRRRQMEDGLRKRVEGLAQKLDALVLHSSSCEDNFRFLVRDEYNQLVRNKCGSYRKNNSLFQAWLRHEHHLIESCIRGCVNIAQHAASGDLSAKADDWRPYQKHSPGIAAWLEYEEAAKLLEYIPENRPRAHPRYRPLVRTGRASCSNPNIQQLPRDGGLRELFIPRPGYVFIACDYSAVELRTLAATCLKRFGHSELAEVFHRGRDPHVTTAASISGLTLGEFENLPASDRKQFRQQAKAINFGVPGGMGAAALVSYAKQTYGVVLSMAQAEEWKKKLTDETYPEIGKYLSEGDAMVDLARNLRADVDACWKAFGFSPGGRGGQVPGFVRRVVRGETGSKAGSPYSQKMLDGVWAKLRKLCADDAIRPLLTGKGSNELADRLFSSVAVTLTGRLRNQCNYTAAHNTPFQGLAADGAKIAMFRLVKAGWTIAAFVHDEILVEVEEGVDLAGKIEELQHIMETAMAEVCGGISITTEAVAMRRWSKSAVPTKDHLGKVLPWDEQPPPSPNAVKLLPAANDSVVGATAA